MAKRKPYIRPRDRERRAFREFLKRRKVPMADDERKLASRRFRPRATLDTFDNMGLPSPWP